MYTRQAMTPVYLMLNEKGAPNAKSRGDISGLALNLPPLRLVWRTPYQSRRHVYCLKTSVVQRLPLWAFEEHRVKFPGGSI